MSTQIDELIHFGVKGMKWGVRNAAETGPEGGGGSDDEPADEDILKALGLPLDATYDASMMANLRKQYQEKMNPNPIVEAVRKVIAGTNDNPVAKFNADVAKKIDDFFKNLFKPGETHTSKEEKVVSINGKKVEHSDMIDELAHFGVQGMRWGRRKPGTGAASDHVAEPSADHVKTQALRHKPLSEMSNDEIQAFTKRLELEKKYKDLTTQKSTIDRGHEKVKKLLGFADTASKIYKVSNSELINDYFKKGYQPKYAVGVKAAAAAVKP